MLFPTVVIIIVAIRREKEEAVYELPDMREGGREGGRKGGDEFPVRSNN
jgi:hypothetical protein